MTNSKTACSCITSACSLPSVCSQTCHRSRLPPALRPTPPWQIRHLPRVARRAAPSSCVWLRRSAVGGRLDVEGVSVFDVGTNSALRGRSNATTIVMGCVGVAADGVRWEREVFWVMPAAPQSQRQVSLDRLRGCSTHQAMPPASIFASKDPPRTFPLEYGLDMRSPGT